MSEGRRGGQVRREGVNVDGRTCEEERQPVQGQAL